MTQTLEHPAPDRPSDGSADAEEHPTLTYVFTGGGTGGHVYPALAIADAVRAKNPNARIVYIGARGRIEAKLVPQRGYPIHLVSASGMPTGRSLFPMLRFLLKTGMGVLHCFILLLRIRPHRIVATGGYASSPVLLAMAALRFLRLTSASCFVHEQNVVPGKVNRLAGWIADRIGVSFQESISFFPPGKAVWVGYPVRQEIGTVAREVARRQLILPNDDYVVFAFGGSQGARSINRGVIDALPALLSRPNVQVIHVVGQTKNAEYDAESDTRSRQNALEMPVEWLKRYHQYAYANEIQTMYAASDLVIGRAGAATVTEICACGLPALLVPLPYAPGDHQAMNARMVAMEGAGWVAYEELTMEAGKVISSLDGKRLSSKIIELIDHPAQRSTMAEKAKQMFDRNGLERILTEINRSSKRGQPSSNGAEPVTPNKTPETGRDAIAGLSPYRLVQRFSKGQDDAYIQLIGDAYLRYRVDGYLMSTLWQIRNEGIKLVGLLGYIERLPFVLAVLKDRTPAPLLQRVFGGDYRQVGFIRRNAVTTIQQLGIYNTEVRDVLIDLMRDRYFETRSAVARAFGTFSSRIGSDETVFNGMRKLMKDRSFEVAVEAIKALGAIGDASLLPDFRVFYTHPNWQIREAILRAMINLIQREKIFDPDLLRGEMSHLLITCNHFDPSFPIKRALSDLDSAIRQAEHTT